MSTQQHLLMALIGIGTAVVGFELGLGVASHTPAQQPAYFVSTDGKVYLSITLPTSPDLEHVNKMLDAINGFDSAVLDWQKYIEQHLDRLDGQVSALNDKSGDITNKTLTISPSNTFTCNLSSGIPAVCNLRTLP